MKMELTIEQGKDKWDENLKWKVLIWLIKFKRRSFKF